MLRIFISYRRVDSEIIVGRIYDRLEPVYGRENIFKDVFNIPPGTDYRSVLKEGVLSSNVVLAIIGPDWLEVKDKHGNQRLHQEADFVRFELATALEADHVHVVPVRVKNADPPPYDMLPQNIADLAYINSIPVRNDPDFHHDMQLLIEHLNNIQDSLEVTSKHLPLPGNELSKEMKLAFLTPAQDDTKLPDTTSMLEQRRGTEAASETTGPVAAITQARVPVTWLFGAATLLLVVVIAGLLLSGAFSSDDSNDSETDAAGNTTTENDDSDDTATDVESLIESFMEFDQRMRGTLDDTNYGFEFSFPGDWDVSYQSNSGMLVISPNADMVDSWEETDSYVPVEWLDEPATRPANIFIMEFEMLGRVDTMDNEELVLEWIDIISGQFPGVSEQRDPRLINFEDVTGAVVEARYNEAFDWTGYVLSVNDRLVGAYAISPDRSENNVLRDAILETVDVKVTPSSERSENFISYEQRFELESDTVVEAFVPLPETWEIGEIAESATIYLSSDRELLEDALVAVDTFPPVAVDGREDDDLLLMRIQPILDAEVNPEDVDSLTEIAIGLTENVNPDVLSNIMDARNVENSQGRGVNVRSRYQDYRLDFYVISIDGSVFSLEVLRSQSDTYEADIDAMVIDISVIIVRSDEFEGEPEDIEAMDEERTETDELSEDEAFESDEMD